MPTTRSRRSITDSNDQKEDGVSTDGKDSTQQDDADTAANLVKNRLKQRLEQSQARAAASKKRKLEQEEKGSNNKTGQEDTTTTTKTIAIPKKKPSNNTAVQGGTSIPKKTDNKNDITSGDKPSLLSAMQKSMGGPSGWSQQQQQQQQQQQLYQHPKRPWSPVRRPQYAAGGPSSPPRTHQQQQQYNQQHNDRIPLEVNAIQSPGYSAITPSGGGLTSNPNPPTTSEQQQQQQQQQQQKQQQQRQTPKSSKLQDMVWNTLEELCQTQIQELGTQHPFTSATYQDDYRGGGGESSEVDMAGSILRNKRLQKNREGEDYDFFDLDGEGRIVVEPKVPMFPEEFTNASKVKRWPLSVRFLGFFFMYQLDGSSSFHHFTVCSLTVFETITCYYHPSSFLFLFFLNTNFQ
jgi:hypothetical protein